MNNIELKALRRFFFLDVKEAAQYIGDVSARAWQRYEEGTRSIPSGVVLIMNQLKQERKEILAILYNKGTFTDLESKSLIYTKLIESAKAELLAKNNEVL